jgi:fluoride exporter
MLRQILAVGAGGFIGSVLRYAVARCTAGLAFANLPLGTLAVNLAGCFVLGLLTGLLERTPCASPEVRLLLTTGLCGGFTTFSTFMGENYSMVRGGQFATLALYLAISIAAGFTLYAAGYWLTGKA